MSIFGSWIAGWTVKWVITLSNISHCEGSELIIIKKKTSIGVII